MNLISWHPNEINNVEILNERIDLYRLSDARAQTEFFYECFEDSVNKTLPEAVKIIEGKYQEILEGLKT